MTPFTLSNFSAILQELPAAHRYWVAYSGGRDSHVLLHALAALRERLPGELCAVHVDHGLSPDAPRWAAHCRVVCKGLGVPLRVLESDARPRRGESPEAAARRVRYQAFAGLMAEHDCLLTAHHQDDQAETLLLQLLRGSGPHGLAAMPRQSAFAAGSHVRPLLDFSRASLAAYARDAALQWVEDESNFDTGIRRNFLRHQLFPLLETLWPAAAATLARSAAHCAEAASLLDALAEADLASVAGPAPRQLSVSALRDLEVARRRNVLRYWCRGLGLPLPRTAHLQRIEQDLLGAGADRMPVLRWEGVEMRRYRDGLYAQPAARAFDRTQVLSWDPRRPLLLPGGNGVLVARTVSGSGLSHEACRQGRLTVRFRQGGERCAMDDGHHHSLKKLLQEHGIPPWERERLPLIYVGDELAAVAGIWVCGAYRAGSGEAGWLIEWRRES
ncbi:MAG: tRNA lysidine(34) synthetase TilS [Gammaproteobacteria bacterium]